MTDTKKIELKCEGIDEKTERDLVAILYAMQIIQRETGHGTLEIEIRDGEIAEMRAEHKIRPKYLNKPM